MYNSIRDLAMYFGSGGRLVSLNEFMWFWSSLTPEERNEFQTTPLT